MPKLVFFKIIITYFLVPVFIVLEVSTHLCVEISSVFGISREQGLLISSFSDLITFLLKVKVN